MTLVRLVSICLHNNLIFRAWYVSTHHSVMANAISRFQWHRFQQMAPNADNQATPLPWLFGRFNQQSDKLVNLKSQSRITWRTYNNALQSFNQFRVSCHLSMFWPAPLDHLMWYIAALSLGGRSPRTARSYISAVLTWHKFNNLFDSTNHFLMIRNISWYDAANTGRQDTCHLLEKVQGVLDRICYSPYEASYEAWPWSSFKIV